MEGKGDSGTSTSFPGARLSWNSSSSSPGVPGSERDFGVCGSAVQTKLSILVERATVSCDACHRGSGTGPWEGTVLIWGEQVSVETVRGVPDAPGGTGGVSVLCGGGAMQGSEGTASRRRAEDQSWGGPGGD